MAGDAVSARRHSQQRGGALFTFSALALVSSIVKAGPGGRHNPIRDPLHWVADRAFGRMTTQPGMTYNRRVACRTILGRSTARPGLFLRHTGALSFLARTSYTSQAQRQQSTSHRPMTRTRHSPGQDLAPSRVARHL